MNSRPHNEIFRCKNNRSQRGSLSLNESNWGVTGGFLRGYLWSLRCFFRSRLFLFSFVLFIIIFHFYSFIWSYFVFCCLILFYHLCSLTFNFSVVSLCLFFWSQCFYLLFYYIFLFHLLVLHNLTQFKTRSNQFKPVQKFSNLLRPVQGISRQCLELCDAIWSCVILIIECYTMLKYALQY